MSRQPGKRESLVDVGVIPLGGNEEYTPAALEALARRLLKRAAVAPPGRGYGLAYFDIPAPPTGPEFREIFIHYGRGGTLTFEPEGAATRLGADLILTIERLGAGAKVRIGFPGKVTE